MTHRPHAPRGFTLIEMVVSLIAAAILVLAAMTVFVQQNRYLENSAADRALQETARTGLFEIGDNLRRAAYGMEPSLAFDFASYSCTGGAVLCRDSITGSDHIVFHARDPVFKASLTAAPTSTTLTLSGGLLAPLRRGQILQVMCAGTADWAYVTLSNGAAANWIPPAAAPASTTLQLQADTGAFPQQNAKLVATGSCFQTDTANVRVYKIDRFHYYVDEFTETDSGLKRPYLMLDRGLFTDDGASRVEPVAPDIEDVQFEYVFYDAVTKATRSVGAVSGTRLSSAATSIDLAATPPVLAAVAEDPSRATNSPANIRGVHVYVVTKSPGPDITKSDAVQVIRSDILTWGPRVPAAANRPMIEDTSKANDLYFGNHVRIRVDSTFQVRNMESRAPFYDR